MWTLQPGAPPGKTALSEMPEADQPAHQLSLRERKFAATKLGLMRAAIDGLQHKPFAELTVKELCERVSVSEATFFNYFSRKDELLEYFIRVWTIEVLYAARAELGESSGLGTIEHIFHATGTGLTENPRLMWEIIAYKALEPIGKVDRQPEDLTLAERLLAFGHLEGAAHIPVPRIDDLFRNEVQHAVRLGELPAGTDVERAVEGILAIFFGIPLWLRWDDPARIPTAYRQQLRLLWAGLRAG